MIEKENSYSFEPETPSPEDFERMGEILIDEEAMGDAVRVERLMGVNGYPVVDNEGNISFLHNAHRGDTYDTTFSEMDLVSYEDEQGVVHSVNLFAVSNGYAAKNDLKASPQHIHTVGAVEQLIKPDGSKSLGSKPAVLFGDEKTHRFDVSSDNYLIDALYIGFQNDKTIFEFIEDKKNGVDVSPTEQKIVSELKIRESDDLDKRPILTTEYWRSQDVMVQDEYEAQTARVMAEREMEREKNWKRKSSLGRAGLRLAYALTPKDGRPKDVRDFKGWDINS